MINFYGRYYCVAAVELREAAFEDAVLVKRPSRLI